MARKRLPVRKIREILRLRWVSDRKVRAARIFQVTRLESDRKQLAAVDMLGPVTLF